ncbi:MAG TPA: MmcQ/YjbR family DNA-binding protein [Thermoanaerobaculia bacterium]|jgi:hypothetical protein
MTEDDFRTLALSLPDAEESAHMGHPDFRVRGKIFATLHGKGFGMVKLTPDQQEMFVNIAPEIFQPVKGGWGLKGATNVTLKKAKKTVTREALLTAWRNVTSAKGRGKASR